MTRSIVPTSLQPSTRAASAYSLGIVTRNCRSRKMENASPNSIGMISGHSVPVRWKRAHMMYIGTIVTCGGSIIVVITRTNASLRPRKRNRASA